MGSHGREDELEVPPVLEVSRTKEGGTKLSLRKCPRCDSLGDRTLSHPCESIQPVDGGLVKVACPAFDLVKNGDTRPFEARLTIPVSILGLFCAVKVIEDSGFSCQRKFVKRVSSGARGILTWVLKRGYFADPDVIGALTIEFNPWS